MIRARVGRGFAIHDKAARPGRRAARIGLLSANVIGGFVLLAAVWPAPQWAPQPGPVHEVIREISARHAHGYPDHYPSVEEMSEAAVKGPVVSTCGPVSEWTVALLQAAGYEARVVSTETLEPPNGWNDGHVLIEVRIDGEWIAYDVDRKFQPTDANGDGLSLASWMARIPTGDYLIRPLQYPVQEAGIRENDRRLLQVQTH